MLSELSDAADGAADRVAVEHILDAIGQRSFGPLMLLPALVALTPLGGIPGVPTFLAVLVIIVAAQLVIGVKRLWAPEVLRKRTVDREALENSAGYLQPVARVVDKVIRPRLDWLTRGTFVRLGAGLCILLALTIPPMEIIPFAGYAPWSAITLFSLAIIAHDGLLALIAFVLAVGGFAFAFTVLL